MFVCAFAFVNTWDELLSAHWHEHLEKASARWNALKFQEFIPGCQSFGAHLNSKMAEIFQEIDGLYQEKRKRRQLFLRITK